MMSIKALEQTAGHDRFLGLRGLAMRIVVFAIAVGFLIAPPSWAQKSTPEEALRILSRGWGGHGAGGQWGEVRNCSYVLECSKRPYCAFSALLCDDTKCDTGPLAEGTFRTTDKRLVRWECRSLDGEAGRVTVDGRAFDLAKGRLFLIVPQKDKVDVFQLHVDLARLPNQSVNELVAEQSKKQPEIRVVLERLGLVK